MKNKLKHITALLMLVVLCSASTLRAQNIDIYTGVLSVDVSGIGGDIISSPDQILLEKSAEDKINLTLKNFDFEIVYLGDIIINDIPVTTAPDGKSEFKSDVISMILAGGDIEAEVQVTGYTKDGKTEIQIDVEWLGVVIPVSFKGDLQTEGLRLNDIKVNGQTLKWTNINGDDFTFNPDVFNYSGVAIGPTDVVTYTKADAGSSVNVEMDGNWLYLYVTKDGKRNRYTLADAGVVAAEGSRPIAKVEIGQDIDGNLVLRNKSELVGAIKVAGTISYYKPYTESEWTTIGLPFELSEVKFVKADESEHDLPTYWYTYNAQAKQVELAGMNSTSIMKLKNGEDVTTLKLVSKLGSSIAEANLASREGYTMVANRMLVSQLANSYGAYDAYYIFDGEKFVQAAETSIIEPATMYIVYKGDNPAMTIDAPDPGKVGIDNVDVDALDVYAFNGQVYVNNFTGVANVYTLSGVNVLNQRIDGEISFNLANGIYIIQTGSKAKVVIVK